MTPGFPSHTHGRPRTPWAVFCGGPSRQAWDNAAHHLVYLTEAEYDLQMMGPDDLWRCPLCLAIGEWNDANYEEMSS